MSHEFESGFLGSRKPAWHGLGTVVDGQPNSADALHLAGLDWRVDLQDVHIIIMGGDGRAKSARAVPDWKATVRSDTGRPLACVGSRYTPIQNVEAFAMADDLIGEGGARFESAGSLKNGRRVWMLAVLPDDLQVADEQIRPYLLLSNAHDGSRAMEVLLTPMRVVCWNTLTWAIAGATNKVKIRHTANARTRILEARRVLGLAGDYFAKHAETAQQLAEYKPDDAFTSAYLKALIPDPQGNASPTRARKARATVNRLFQGSQAGAQHDAIQGTAYGLLNAVGEFVDHYRTVRASKSASRAENRMESVLYGSGAALRDRAYGLMSRATGIGHDGRALVDQVDNPTADDVLGMLATN